MCILITPGEPEASLLVLAPLQPDAGVQRWQLSYANSVPSPPLSPVLMVVPLPNHHAMSEPDFVLSSFEPPDVRAVRTHSKALFRPYTPGPPSPSHFGFGSSGGGATDPPLLVQEVGAYQISVAPSLRDLETRAPWAQLDVPSDRVESILQGMREAYPCSFAFLIARADHPPVESGFSVVYRHVSPFFPTAHESLAAPSGLVRMDACLIGVNIVIDPTSVCSAEQVGAGAATWDRMSQHPMYRVDDSGLRTLPPRWAAISNLLRSLPVRGAGELHGAKILRHDRPLSICRWELQATCRNENVMGRKMTPSELSALHEIYEEVDSWLTLRYLHGTTSPTTNLQPLPLGFTPVPELPGTIAAHAPAADFVIMLTGRQLAMPGIADRVSDAPSVFGNAHIPQMEIFYNLDFAAHRGPDDSIDLDSFSFARKDSPQFATLKDGRSLIGTVFARVSATPAPHLIALEARTVVGTH